MDSAEMVYCATREEWRDWLEGNHDKCKGIWLIYYKKGSGKPRVPYDDAVEEALCFGWIDSTVKRIDEEKYAQQFTPRKPDSGWSESEHAAHGAADQRGPDVRRRGWRSSRIRPPHRSMTRDLDYVTTAGLHGSAGERPEGAWRTSTSCRRRRRSCSSAGLMVRKGKRRSRRG